MGASGGVHTITAPSPRSTDVAPAAGSPVIHESSGSVTRATEVAGMSTAFTSVWA
jgi:hypothetical protein